jgi:hypothetical protein
MKSILKIVSVLSLFSFLTIWAHILPEKFNNQYFYIYAPIILSILLIITGGGLVKNLDVILRVFCIIIFGSIFSLTVYYIGESGGVGVVVIWFLGGLTCAAMYVILLITEIIQRFKQSNGT